MCRLFFRPEPGDESGLGLRKERIKPDIGCCGSQPWKCLPSYASNTLKRLQPYDQPVDSAPSGCASCGQCAQRAACPGEEHADGGSHRAHRRMLVNSWKEVRRWQRHTPTFQQLCSVPIGALCGFFGCILRYGALGGHCRSDHGSSGRGRSGHSSCTGHGGDSGTAAMAAAVCGSCHSGSCCDRILGKHMWWQWQGLSVTLCVSICCVATAAAAAASRDGACVSLTVP